jgi:hypothetical protein
MWLGRKMKEKRREVHGKAASRMREACGRLGERLRLRERIDAANKWAAAHPKKTAAMTVGALVLSLLLNFAISGAGGQNREPELDGIADVQPMFEGMRRIQNGKSLHKEIMAGLVSEGQALRREIDSLRLLPVKTRGDSVRIVEGYRKLEGINEMLKNECDE